jgi:hypothetical protein
LNANISSVQGNENELVRHPSRIRKLEKYVSSLDLFSNFDYDGHVSIT